MSFADAQQKCIDEGLELPIPASAAEADIVNASGSVGPVWLGITDNVTEDTWIRRVFKTMLETRLLKFWILRAIHASIHASNRISFRKLLLVSMTVALLRMKILLEMFVADTKNFIILLLLRKRVQ